MTRLKGDEIDIRACRGDDELRAVRRFWYEVYVRELGRHRDAADPATRELPDPRDRHGDLLVAWQGRRVVGTVLSSPAMLGQLGDYERFYDMRALGDGHPRATTIVTKLMVAADQRHGPLSVRLARAIYALGMRQGICHAFIDCNDYLLPFFRALGFRPWRGPSRHPEYGLVHILKLDLFDREHLRRIGSPFAADLSTFSRSRQDVPHPSRASATGGAA